MSEGYIQGGDPITHIYFFGEWHELEPGAAISWAVGTELTGNDWERYFDPDTHGELDPYKQIVTFELKSAPNWLVQIPFEEIRGFKQKYMTEDERKASHTRKIK